MGLPALRYLDVSPLVSEGEQVFCLRDQDGYVEDALVLSPLALLVATYLNGKNTVADIQRAVVKDFGGEVVMADDITKIVSYLDDHGFLMTEKFEAIRSSVCESFARATVRPAHFAGKSYPEEPTELMLFIDQMFLREGGPGKLPGQRPGKGNALRCLVVPHIDFSRGGHVYAHGYLKLFRSGKPDTVFVFGVAHASPPTPFVLTRKDFETPLGIVRVDQEIMDEIEPAAGPNPYEHELVQRTEHSIEFHAVMLAYLFGADVKIVPVLCGPFRDESGVTPPSQVDRVRRFLDACKAAVEKRSDRVTVVASADLAHVGQRFGDDFEINEPIIETVRMRDREDLSQAAAMNADGWFASVMKDENQRRVCGINCVYASLKSIDGTAKKGKLLHYDYAPDPSGGIVSFASMAFG